MTSNNTSIAIIEGGAMKQLGDLFVGVLVATCLVECVPASQATQEKVKAPIVGTWRVTSWEGRNLETNEVFRSFGENPTGYVQCSLGGHMVAFLQVGNPRQPASVQYTDPE